MIQKIREWLDGTADDCLRGELVGNCVQGIGLGTVLGVRLAEMHAGFGFWAGVAIFGGGLLWMFRYRNKREQDDK